MFGMFDAARFVPIQIVSTCFNRDGTVWHVVTWCHIIYILCTDVIWCCSIIEAKRALRSEWIQLAATSQNWPTRRATLQTSQTGATHGAIQSCALSADCCILCILLLEELAGFLTKLLMECHGMWSNFWFLRNHLAISHLWASSTFWPDALARYTRCGQMRGTWFQILPFAALMQWLQQNV